MTVERIPLTQPIETRDGTLTKDAKNVNGYFETRGNGRREFVKRPGLTTFANLGTGAGQGMYYLNGTIYAAQNNILSSIDPVAGTVTTLGTMTSTGISNVYFGQSETVYTPTTSSGTIDYILPGKYTWTVPTGVTIATVTISGAGGGGGWSILSGDSHGAGNGSSGGYYLTTTIGILTPGSTVTIVVGAAGTSGTVSVINGGTGGTSSISGTGFTTLTATGGGGGFGVIGDNAPVASGAAGLPNGTVGSSTATWMVNRNTSGQGFDVLGQNPTGYGFGGLGGNNVGTILPINAGNGYVSLSW